MCACACLAACSLTVAGEVGDGQRPGQLQLVVVRRDPGQDALEDAALPALEQLLHGLVCNTNAHAQRFREGDGGAALCRCCC